MFLFKWPHISRTRLFLIRNNIGLLEQDLGNIRELCV